MQEQTEPQQYLVNTLLRIIFGLIFFLGVLGNCLVIAIFIKKYRHKTHRLNTTNRFILNLAIADLLFLFFCVPFHATIYTGDEWYFGGFMCVFTKVCQVTFMLASIYTMVALSLERYFAIVHATSTLQLRTGKNANICIGAIWILAIGIGSVSSITMRQITAEEINKLFNLTSMNDTNSTPGNLLMHNEEKFFCWENSQVGAFLNIYKVIIAITGYIFPLAFIFICYLGVVRVMMKKPKSAAILCNRRSQEAKKRVTKIVILVVIFFAILWFLHHFCALWIAFGDFNYTTATFVLIIVAHCLSYAFSCVNPIIYAFVSKRYRNDLKSLLSCCSFLKPSRLMNCNKCPGKAHFKGRIEMCVINSDLSSDVYQSVKKGEEVIVPLVSEQNKIKPSIEYRLSNNEKRYSTCLLAFTPVTSHLTKCLTQESYLSPQVSPKSFSNLANHQFPFTIEEQHERKDKSLICNSQESLKKLENGYSKKTVETDSPVSNSKLRNESVCEKDKISSAFSIQDRLQDKSCKNSRKSSLINKNPYSSNNSSKDDFDSSMF